MKFEAELEDHLTRRDAERTLRAVTAWGRYTELFAYDDRTHTFSEIQGRMSAVGLSATKTSRISCA